MLVRHPELRRQHAREGPRVEGRLTAAQRGAQAGGVTEKILAEFALAEACLAGGMSEFDGILERDNMDLLRLVHLVQQRGQRGGLAHAGRTGGRLWQSHQEALAQCADHCHAAG